MFFLIGDAVLISLSVFLGFLVRFEGQIPSQYFVGMGNIMILALVITLPIFYFFRLYYFNWSYASASELIALFKGAILSFLLVVAAFFVLREQPAFSGFPRSVLFITYFFIFFLCGGLRFSKRFYLQFFSFKGKKEKERTLIVGAGDAGEQILRSILALGASPFLPVGFADDDPNKERTLIHGIKVLGRIKNIPAIIRKNNIEGMIIAIPSADAQTIHVAVERGREAGLRKIKIVPGIEDIMTGRITLGQLQEVEMNDLLGREQLSLDKKSIESFIKEKKVLVTGAAGSIGSELCWQIAKFEPLSLTILDQDETGIFNISKELRASFPKLKKLSLIADITDKEKIENIFKELKPDIVFHAAAYKHVPLMEKHPDEAVKNNVFGTENVAKAALANKTEKFILISTDKAVNPVSVMGMTKRAAEMICCSLNQKNQTRFVSVRFGNVLDSRGSCIPIFREKIKRREPIEVTHPEMKRYFMTTPEACLLVMQAGAMGQGGEVFVLDMGDPVKIMDLAREMIRLSGLEPDKDIPIVFSEPRPGEKMSEELLTAEEGTLATCNEKIFQAKLSKVSKRGLDMKLQKIKISFKKGKKEDIVKSLKDII